MNKNYVKVTTEFGSHIYFMDGSRKISFTEIPGNRHYEEYLEWIAEGNTPEVIND